MNLALEKNTGKKVRAIEGKTYRSYKCPQCFGALTFVEPATQVAHFRHLPHAAKRDCPLYHASAGYDVSTLFKNRAFRLHQPKLFLRLSNQTPLVKWHLILLVPPIQGVKSFAIKHSPNHGMIPMRAVKPHGSEFPVFPSHEPYSLGLLRTDDTSEIEQIDGLGLISIFHLRPDLGGRIERTQYLVVGDSYVAVYAEKFSLDLPSDLKCKVLSSNEGWKSFVFRISESSAVQDWCKKVLGFDVRIAAPAASVLWPPEARQGNDGVWSVPQGKRAVVAINCQNLFCNSVSLLHETGKAPESISLSTAKKLVLIERLSDGYHELCPAIEGLEPICMIGSQRALAPTGEAISFEFEGGQSVRTEPIWSIGLIPALSLVAARKARLVSIHIPKGVPIKFTSIVGNTSHTTAIVGEKNSDILRDRIAASLGQTGSRFEIDAAGFGKLCYPSRVAEVKKPERKHTAREAWLELAKPRSNSSTIFDATEFEADFRAHLTQLK